MHYWASLFPASGRVVEESLLNIRNKVLLKCMCVHDAEEYILDSPGLLSTCLLDSLITIFD